MPARKPSTKASSLLKKNRQVPAGQRASTTTPHGDASDGASRRIEHLEKQVAHRDAELDKLKKAVASGPKTKGSQSLILPPEQINHLQTDMGLKDNRSVYNQCRRTVSDAMKHAGIKFNILYKNINPTQLATAAKLARHDYEPLRKYDTDWASYEIMKGILAYYRNNQRRRNQTDPTPETTTPNSETEDNDELEDKNSGDDSSTDGGNSEMEDVVASDKEIEGNNLTGDELDGDNDDIDGEDINSDFKGNDPDYFKVQGTELKGASGDEDELMDDIEQEESEPKQQKNKTTKKGKTTARAQKLVAKKVVQKGRNRSNAEVCAEERGDESVQQMLRVGSKRLRSNMDNTPQDTVPTKRTRQGNSNRTNVPSKVKGKRL